MNLASNPASRSAEVAALGPSLRKVKCEMRPGPYYLLIYKRCGRSVLQRRSRGVKDDDFIPEMRPGLLLALES